MREQQLLTKWLHLLVCQDDNYTIIPAADQRKPPGLFLILSSTCRFVPVKETPSPPPSSKQPLMHLDVVVITAFRAAVEEQRWILEGFKLVKWPKCQVVEKARTRSNGEAGRIKMGALDPWFVFHSGSTAPFGLDFIDLMWIMIALCSYKSVMADHLSLFSWCKYKNTMSSWVGYSTSRMFMKNVHV